MLPQWIDDGLPFSCTGCGKCCTGAPGYIWINEEEIEAIANRLEITIDTFLKEYTIREGDRISLRDLPEKNYDCIFLEGKGCTIYDERPTQCRTYPFWPQNLESKESWLREAAECEGIRADAPLVKKERIEREARLTKEKSTMLE